LTRNEKLSLFTKKCFPWRLKVFADGFSPCEKPTSILSFSAAVL
jgi:hypothetical protein